MIGTPGGTPSGPPSGSPGGSTGPALDPELLAILRCPLSRAPLVLEGDRLLCYESRKAYRIEDGFPVLLIEEAEEIPEERIPPEHRRKS